MSTIMHNANDKLISNKGTKNEENNNNKQNTTKNKIKNSNNLNISNINNTSSDISSTNPQYPQQQPQLDIEKENRLSQIITLYSKGLTQSEIAEKMGVNQSTISRDLQYIQQEAKKRPVIDKIFD